MKKQALERWKASGRLKMMENLPANLESYDISTNKVIPSDSTGRSKKSGRSKKLKPFSRIKVKSKLQLDTDSDGGSFSESDISQDTSLEHSDLLPEVNSSPEGSSVPQHSLPQDISNNHETSTSPPPLSSPRPLSPPKITHLSIHTTASLSFPLSSHTNASTSPTSPTVPTTTNATPLPPPQPPTPPLLTLPTELLQSILTYTLTSPSQPISLSLSRKSTHLPSHPLNPLLTSRFLHTLSLPLYYRSNTLRLDSPAQLLSFLTDLSPERRAHIRSLEIGGLGCCFNGSGIDGGVEGGRGGHYLGMGAIAKRAFAMLGLCGGLRGLTVELGEGVRWSVLEWGKGRGPKNLGHEEDEDEDEEGAEDGGEEDEDEEDEEGEEDDDGNISPDDVEVAHELEDLDAALTVLATSVRGLEYASIRGWNRERPGGEWLGTVYQTLGDRALRRVWRECNVEIEGIRRVDWIKAQWKKKRGAVEGNILRERGRNGRRGWRVTGGGDAVVCEGLERIEEEMVNS